MRIAIVCTAATPIIETDVTALSREHEVHPIALGKLPVLVGRIHKMVAAIVTSDACIFWFAEFPALLGECVALLLQKTSLVIVGGFEIIDEPNWSYGGRRGLIRRLITFLTLRLARQIVTVSPAQTTELLLIYPWAKPELIPNGVDTKFFDMSVGAKQPNSVISVVYQGSNISLKGVDRLLETAKRLPAVEFAVVGIARKNLDEAKFPVPANVRIVPPVDRLVLREMYQRSWVVCQLSRRESFGLALAEGMACGCVPIATAVGIWPEMTRGLGRLVSGDDASETAEAIRWALGQQNAHLARRRILGQFTIERRSAHLVSALSGTPERQRLLPEASENPE